MNLMRPTAWLAAAGLLAWAVAAGQTARLEFAFATLEGAGVRASDVRLAVTSGDDGPSGQLDIGVLSFGKDLSFSGLAVTCPRLAWNAQRVSCDEGLLVGDLPYVGSQRSRVSWRWDRQRAAISATIHEMKIAGGTVSLEAEVLGDGARYRLRGTGLAAAQLTALATAVTGVAMDFGLDGRVNAESVAHATAAGLNGELRVSGTGLTGSNPDGTLAFEALKADLQAALAADGDLSLTLRISEGQTYAEPVFLDFTATPGGVSARLSERGGEFILREASVDLGATLAATAKGAMQWRADTVAGGLDLRFDSGNATALYDVLLKPFLYATTLDDLAVSGRISGAARLAGLDLESLALDLDGVGVTDRQNRFAFTDLRGRLAWPGAETGPGRPSYLAWAGGALYGLALGPSAAAFSAGPEHFRLLEPTRFPLLDGALRVERLEIAGTSGDDASAAIQAALEPVSLDRLTLALGWPAFSGELSGTLPLLRYENGEAVVGGSLRASVFDGEISVDQLRLVEPLGEFPRLFAGVTVRHLDLEALTEAFSFGRITGRLDGDVGGLEMIAWSPVAFDARLFSSPGSKDRRRISQRAVENISSIGGGGAAAALSGTFMRFFEDFAYREIGIRCRLERGVCHMGGVAPAESGYYLVQGRGVPRIDVVGYADQVDWPRLVAQLKSVSLEGDLRVE